MKHLVFFLSASLLLSASCARKAPVVVVSTADSSPRIALGVERLQQSLKAHGYSLADKSTPAEKCYTIVVGCLADELVQLRASQAGIAIDEHPDREGYLLRSGKNGLLVAGADASGTLYGCLDVCDRLARNDELPNKIDVREQPEMVLRGACIGVQKPYYLPGRTVYEYPYTPEVFPWFYDKKLWVEYLDMLLENRMNSLYLWNGHPFASLVRLPDYPYAVEVDSATFAKNEEIFGFLTEEANRRGIFVIQMFYNIIVSKPFAERHGIKTQDRSRPIVPVIADYTRKSIAAFIEKYPNVGLLVTLGEAMRNEDDVEWFTQTIIPGVKDGLASLGRTDEPPILLRSHDTDARSVMAAALPLYKNLYTMSKYTGESLTTYQPRGPWAKTHKDLSELGSVHIDNVHILSNLEPYRYGSPEFIRKTAIAMHDAHGANGLHLYPQASYWDWPYTADNTPQRLLEMERDWIWYKAWGRYAWDSQLDPYSEAKYWSKQLGDFYGCGKHGRKILDAYNESGEIAPKLLRRFGITEGNRQTLQLGMFMAQLVNPYKFRIYPEFYESCGPEGEKLIEWAEREWKGEPHVGETPTQIIDEVQRHGRLAVEAAEQAAPHVTKNTVEFERLKNDMRCLHTFACYFAQKVKAGECVLRYQYSHDLADLDLALPHLEQSVELWQQLVALTESAYLYANSMQTRQRRIPIGGDDGKHKTWKEMLPHYERELNNFRRHLERLKLQAGGGQMPAVSNAPLRPADVRLRSKQHKLYPLAVGEKLFSDADSIALKAVADELQGLQFLRLSMAEQQADKTLIAFACDSAVSVLVGYFNSGKSDYLQPPTLETNASANDRGQAEALFANALDVSCAPSLNVHAYRFEAGEHTLELGKGAALVLGFVGAAQQPRPRDAGLGSGARETVDWLFY
ncbi:MAG: glycoside hydrolase family 20 zincin-like fold domain-containing protein [Prevotellaceae bacterium]|jgi:hypothetical protein|nr:glycoside hydrolase family 20 zincin-like fold domain-containing protein [Prevotellaceae bacterium]